jgi:HSP20 family protein
MRLPEPLDPHRDHPIVRIHHEINRAFERFLGDPHFRTMPMMPAINMKEEADRYVIEAELPGIEDKDIDIEIHGNTLTIKGERRMEERREGERMHIFEHRYGAFHRSVTLPDHALLDHIEAERENGILRIFVPKDQSKQPRKIPIRRTGEHH